jgi:twitching motility protein PilJ
VSKRSSTTEDSQLSSSKDLLNSSHQDSGLKRFAQSFSKISFLREKPSLWQNFSNLSIARKQLIVLIASELISIFGLGIVSRYLTTTNLQALSLEQAKSEVAVTDVAYNIKVNQMGFGFRGQSDNTAIIKAAMLNASGQSLSPNLKAEVKQILTNEIKARKIEYATLVGNDFKIIVNANADRQGQIFNPDNLVSEVFNYPKQIKASRIVKWSELSRESPPLPSGFRNQDALIRYTVTPVKNPETNVVIGALVSGDIVNGKNSILKSTLTTTGGGYSAVYFHQPTGEFRLATSLAQGESEKTIKF